MCWRSQAAWGVVVCLGLIAAPSPAAAEMVVARIQADYDLIADNNTTIRITNLSAAPLSDITLSGVGYGGTIDGLAATIEPRPGLILQPGQRLTYTFDSKAPVFQAHFADTYTGNVRYTVEANWQGTHLAAAFSPDENAAGEFVPFLGNGRDGKKLAPGMSCLDTLALLRVAELPEPGTLPLVVGGIGSLLTYAWRRRGFTATREKPPRVTAG
jgi:hypothetical protein